MSIKETTPVKDWKITHHQLWKFNDIVMGHAISSYQKHDTQKSSNTKDVVRLHFGLRGDYNFKFHQIDKRYELIGGHHNIMYSDGIDLSVENKSLEIETFGVSFPKQLFVDFADDSDPLLSVFCDKVLQGENCIISDNWGTINAEIQKVIDEIIENPYSGSLQKIFLLAKSLELLVLCIDNYKRVNEVRPRYIKTKDDKAKIIAVRDLINKEYQNPPSLSDIAKEVGMNEFKLKNGFKETFDSTIFSYITDKRLNSAKQFLLNSEKTISEIAYHFGYSSPQHFSHQFKKKFGRTPKSVRNIA